MLDRRQFLVAAAAMPLVARAQQGGTRIIVGFPPGGVVDVTARALAEGLRGRVDEPLVVDNRAGAGGRIAVETVKGAAPNGLTLLYSPPGMFTVYPHIDAKLRYDPFMDFIPVSTLCSFPFALAVAPNLPVRSLAEFLAWAKANPRDAAYGSPGTGTIQSFIGAMLSRAGGADMTHVPYKGGAQSITDLIAGTIASTISVAQLFTANHKAGKLRVLAVSGSARLASLPEVPTFAEQGYPALTFEEWFGVLVPARTPAAKVDKLAAAIQQAAESPAVRDTLAKLDYRPFVEGPANFSQLLRKEHARWSTIVKETGFKPQ